MATWTLANIRTKLERDLATEDEQFVQQTELTEYINEAIREAEAEIHKLGVEDSYFEARTTVSLVTGQEEYDFPSDIYANKIRRIVYKKDNLIYEVRRMRRNQRYFNYVDLNITPTTTDRYQYMVINNASTGPRLVLVPYAQETISNALQMWYIRNARELSLDADVCDIPEFINFIFQYVKVRVYEKEVGHPNLEKAMRDLEGQRKLMIETLTDMVVDEDTQVEQDFSFYEESI